MAGWLRVSVENHECFDPEPGSYCVGGRATGADGSKTLNDDGSGTVRGQSSVPIEARTNMASKASLGNSPIVPE